VYYITLKSPQRATISWGGPLARGRPLVGLLEHTKSRTGGPARTGRPPHFTSQHDYRPTTELPAEGDGGDHPRRRLARALTEAAKKGRPLRVKVGFDPTAPDLHLGHTVLIRKMKHFQDMGHTVIFLIGDMTAMIGDPSGRNVTRPPMTTRPSPGTPKPIRRRSSKSSTATRPKSASTATARALKYMDMVRLFSKYTVARMLERDFFASATRWHPILMHEMIYPLAQGYDSVALECDIEMGGTDQKFNLLVGREIQRDFGQPPQIVLPFPFWKVSTASIRCPSRWGTTSGSPRRPRSCSAR